MSLNDKIGILIRNKIFLYVSSRYVSYGLQFVNSILLAVLLYDYYPAYGFILIVLQYITLCNLGIPYSLNIFLSFNKENKEKMHQFLSTSIFIYLFVFAFIFAFFYLTPLVGVEIGEKYHFHNYTLFVVLIGIFSHLNALYSNYFRVINRLNEIVFCQSVIPVSVFCLLFFFKGETLLNLILWAMLIGNITALILFLSRERLQTFKPDFSLMQPMIKKAFFLFLYNTFFYLILLSTRTIVSEQYSAVEFGLFTFSYTMANSIVLLFDSFSFLIYPKAINRFSKADSTEVLRIVDLIRKNYITSIHFVMYLFILLFPLIILFFPQYSSIFECFALITLTVVLYSNCFPYSSYLIAMGKEKLLSALSGVVLALNVLFALYISLFLKTGYEYVILATLLSYFIYNILLVFFSNRLLIDIMTFGKFLRLTFPARLFVPFFIILGLVLFDASYICYFFVWGLFVLLNKNQLKEIMITLKKIAQDSSVINV